jgi:hypothetical protein
MVISKAQYLFHSNNRSGAYANKVDLTNKADFVLVCPVFQSSIAFNLRDKAILQLAVRYSFSVNEPLPTGESSPPELLDFGISFQEESRLQTLTLLVQYWISSRGSNKRDSGVF